MCGLAGFSGVRSDRKALTFLLGLGIDRRGRDAVGYVATHATIPRVGRRLGQWGDASEHFLRAAAASETVAMHARFATSGGKGLGSAHPFTIRRNGRVVLHGQHNGCLYNTRESAARHNRPHDVDSRELFELLADNDLPAIQKIQGYGVIQWVMADDPRSVLLAKLSGSGEISVNQLATGGVVWASTDSIVVDAVSSEISQRYRIDTGKIYRIADGEILDTGRQGLHVAESWWTRDSTQHFSGKAFDGWDGWDGWGDDAGENLADLADRLDRDDRDDRDSDRDIPTTWRDLRVGS